MDLLEKYWLWWAIYISCFCVGRPSTAPALGEGILEPSARVFYTSGPLREDESASVSADRNMICEVPTIKMSSKGPLAKSGFGWRRPADGGIISLVI